MRRTQPFSRKWGGDRGLPIDRYCIERFLAKNSTEIRGRVLEVDDNAYTRRFGGAAVTHSDILHVEQDHAKATIVTDLTAADHVASDQFDCVICTQTLQLIYDVCSAPLIEIGGHSVNHRSLRGLSPAEQEDEIQGCRESLQHLLKRKITGFAYPYGTEADYDEQTARAVTQAGFVCFLDNDMTVEPDFHLHLVRPFAAYSRLAQTNGKIMDLNNPGRIYGAGGCRLNFWRGNTRHLGYGELDTGEYDELKPCMPSGGCMMVRAETFFELVSPQSLTDES